MVKMTTNKSKENNTFSIKLFFVVIFLIVAYQALSFFGDEPEWRSYNPENKLFTLDVSGDIDRRIIEEVFQFGDVPFDFITFSKGSVQYAVSHAELPDTVSGRPIIDFAINSSKKMMQIESVEVLKDSLSHVLGQRVLIEAPDGSEFVQLVAWHQGNLFRLMVVGKGLSGGQSSRDVEHFLRSFNFLTSNKGSNTLLFQ
tara:strand:- start:26 stop:622 length:597 start_codon:yes stop_codon:yes gene_type:complete